MQAQKNTQAWTTVTSFLFYLLLGSYPVLSFIWRRSYPLLSAEVVIIFFSILVLSAVLAILDRYLRRLTRSFLITVAVVTVLLLQFNFLLEGLALSFALVLLVAWKVDSRAYALGIPVVAATMIGALIDSFHDPRDFATNSEPIRNTIDKPPIVHIILDSFIGLAGLPDTPAADDFRSEMGRFLSEYQFNVYPRAYSRYPTTGDSLYAAFNFRHGNSNRFLRETIAGQEHALQSNRYFDVLAGEGYRLNIFQTGHLDFCRTHPQITELCWNYPLRNVHTIPEVPGAGKRAGMLVKVMLTQSRLLTQASKDLLWDPGVGVHDPAALRELEAALFAEPGGRAFLAHLLLPHSPFVYRDDCTVDYDENTYLSYAILPGDRKLASHIIEYRTRRYLEQANCALLTLGKLFDDMKKRGIFGRAIIVLHGDHGSLVGAAFPSASNLQELRLRDYHAHYSTLFATRFPGGQYRIDPRTLPIATLLEEFSARLAGNPISSPGTENEKDSPRTEEFVYLPGTYGLTRVKVDLFAE